MDVVVTPADEGRAWTLTDLLGRSKVLDELYHTEVRSPVRDAVAVGTGHAVEGGAKSGHLAATDQGLQTLILG